jgi:hypothetical protein
MHRRDKLLDSNFCHVAYARSPLQISLPEETNASEIISLKELSNVKEK